MKELCVELGRYDNPQKQTQDDYCYDLLKSNLAVFGSSMSGKTTLLKTLLLRLHQRLGLTDKEEIYILDFGNGLKRYEKLPYVLGYFNASHEENVRRVFRILEGKLAENMRSLGGESYIDAKEEKQPNHVTFLLDGFSSFVSEDRYGVYHDGLKKLAREGLSKGITVILSAAETSGFARISSSFGRIIAFELSKDQYGELFSGKVEKPMALAGRGVANRNTDTYEFQAYLPAYIPWKNANPEAAEEAIITRTERWIKYYGMEYDPKLLEQNYTQEESAKEVVASPENKKVLLKNKELLTAYLKRKLKILPEGKLTPEKWHDCCETPFENENGDFSAGLDYYTLEPVPKLDPPALNLREAQTIAIYGRKEFGKSNLLKLLLEAADKLPDTQFYFWDDGRQALTKPAGLRKTIDALAHKEFINSREDFLKCLYHCGFLMELEQANKLSLVGDHLDPQDLFDDSEACDQKRKELREKLDLWDKSWHASFLEKRERMSDEGTWDREAGNAEREEHEWEYSKREADIERQVDLWRQERRQQNGLSKAEPTARETKHGSSLTVFVVQSRLFYQNPPNGEQYHMIPRIASAIGTHQKPFLFIFSDVQRIESSDVQTYFNNSIRYAFLLDDIVRFINSRGQRSVFSNQELSDLKERFGPCEVGDGFFFDIDRDDLTKLKFLYTSPDGA